jgi:hypothetical protein
VIYCDVSPNEPLSQGDILDECPLLFWQASEFGGQMEPVTRLVRVVVLTQACDVAQLKANRILVACVHSARELVERNVLKGKLIREQIRSHRVYGWYFLPAGAVLSESIVDLRDLHTIPRTMLEHLIQRELVESRSLIHSWIGEKRIGCNPTLHGCMLSPVSPARSGASELRASEFGATGFLGRAVDGQAWIPASWPGFSRRTFLCPKFACPEKRRSRLAWLARGTAAGGGKRFEHVASRSARCEMDSIRTSLQAPFSVSMSFESRPDTRRRRPALTQATRLVHSRAVTLVCIPAE